MLHEIRRLAEVEPCQLGKDYELDSLRSVMRATTGLPSVVIEANFSHVVDRVLDEVSIAALTDPTTHPGRISDERRNKRKKALAPYSGKRLLAVLVNLPGVLYTIEIDPLSEKVVHWECVAK